MTYSTSIGLDVHARSICASALVHATGEIVRSSFGYDAASVAEWARSLPQPCRAVYESGPTGFELKRSLDSLGLPTVVGAVTKMLRPSGDRVKTDRRDADFLARMLAVGNVAECGDLSRFRSARAFMSFVGLVPSESSSGESVSRGAITKAGNSHVRRLLVEAARHHERPLRAAPAAAKAAVARDGRLAQECERRNLRPDRRFPALRARRKHGSVIAAAVARELAGFVWAIGSEAQALAAQGTPA